MKNYYLSLILLMFLASSVYAFNCQLDGSCFIRCIENGNDMSYCRDKCTNCH